MCPKQVHEGSSDLLYVQCGYDRLREPTNPKRGLGLVVVYRGSGAPGLSALGYTGASFVPLILVCRFALWVRITTSL